MADQEPEKTIADDFVVTKYKMAGEIVNRVLKKLIAMCVPGASVYEICAEGDRLLREETDVVFKKDKDVKKGIAFPTSCSINNCICHFSPLKSDKPVLLKEGDLVKLDLGAHVDGFIAVVAHSVIVRPADAPKDEPITGRAADVMLAAHYAADAAIRALKPGAENYKVTDVVTRMADQFGCKPVSGMLSHQLKQFRIDGDKSIIQNPTDVQRKDHTKCEFETHEVYAVDVLISTGEGKGREVDNKTTIFKKTDVVYQLKMKAARTLFSDVSKNFGQMPFNLRSCEEENRARLGLHECVEHKLLDPFNVLHERDSELVAQFKFTILLMTNGSTNRLTGLPLDLTNFKSEHTITDPELKAVLATGLGPKKNKKPAAGTTGDQKAAAGGGGGTTTSVPANPAKPVAAAGGGDKAKNGN